MVETNLNFFILDVLTYPPRNNTPWDRIGILAARLSCLDKRFAEFAADAGVDYGSLTVARRNDVRAEVDALVARAYDLTADEPRFVIKDLTGKALSPTCRQMLEKFRNQ
ncbi:MAG: hypothetical protein OXP66_05755 [Candidatus Tectomicrobia bacterium]|nr:hypothetical protein [Candidatus Tectomicrobia bacterium]